jgi:DNA-binding protein Fis
MMVHVVEKPLEVVVMQTRQQPVRAAQWLGSNRNTCVKNWSSTN